MPFDACATLVATALIFGAPVGLSAQTKEADRVRAVVAALAQYSVDKNLAAMDTLGGGRSLL